MTWKKEDEGEMPTVSSSDEEAWIRSSRTGPVVTTVSILTAQIALDSVFNL